MCSRPAKRSGPLRFRFGKASTEGFAASGAPERVPKTRIGGDADRRISPRRPFFSLERVDVLCQCDPPYSIVKYQDFAPTFLAASVPTIFTVFLPLESLGELYVSTSVEAR